MSSPFPILIGTLNRKLAFFAEARCEGPGLASGWLDPETGAFTQVDAIAGIDNPAFLTLDGDRRTAYCTSEVHAWHEGVISAVAVDPQTLKLTYLNKQAALGSCTSHLSLDETGRYLLATNYMIGDADVRPGISVVSFPLRADGSIAPPAGTARLSGSGPVASRQERAHAHCIFAVPGNRHVIVSDLGADVMVTIPFDPESGELGGDHRVHALPPGSGPRHFIIHPEGKSIYLLNELSGTLAWFGLMDDGALVPRGAISARHPGATGHNDSSDLQLSPDGRFLYAANRGDDTVGIFALAPDGSLALVGHHPTLGHWPRNLALTPDGGLLLVSNQYSDTIGVLRVDRQTGLLSELNRIAIGTPMCVRFLDRVEK